MILAGQKEAVAQWICDRIRDMPHPPRGGEYEAIGFLDKNGRIKGGVLYTNCSTLPDGTHDICMSIAGEPGWITKAGLRAAFSYPFITLNCSRVTAIAAKANKKAREINERIGWIHEGTLRGAFGRDTNGNPKDGILYGMLRENCPWIR